MGVRREFQREALRLGIKNPLQYSWLGISWTQKPSRLQSMASQRVGHNLATKLPSGSVGKESACNAGDPGLILGLGRSPGEGNGNTFRYAWEIPWTEEPGRLQSMGSQRIGYN